MLVDSAIRISGNGPWITYACGRTSGTRWPTEQEARAASATACDSPDCLFRHAVIYKAAPTVRIRQAEDDSDRWERRHGIDGL
jgi:hypothetical protein